MISLIKYIEQDDILVSGGLTDLEYIHVLWMIVIVHTSFLSNQSIGTHSYLWESRLLQLINESFFTCLPFISIFRWYSYISLSWWCPRQADLVIVLCDHPQDVTYRTLSPGLISVGNAAHIGSLQQFWVGKYSWPNILTIFQLLVLKVLYISPFLFLIFQHSIQCNNADIKLIL